MSVDHIQLQSTDEEQPLPPKPLTDRSLSSNQGTLVITRRIKEEFLNEYNIWLKKIGDECAKFPGFLHRTIYAPSKASVTQDFWTHIIHFETNEDAQKWTSSNIAHELWKECEPFTNDTNIAILMDGSPEIWGMSPASSGKYDPATAAAAGAAMPVVSKPLPFRQSLTVWVNLYPLLLILSYLLEFIYGKNEVSLPVRLLVSTALSVPMLSYFMIPLSMRYLAPWVFDQDKDEMKAILLSCAILIFLGGLCAIMHMIWPKKSDYAGEGIW
jgi:uncharacterized protein